ncbi:Heterokaryon incompatibility [Moelleriella libera RCEF 2490]|uniref:Heterokaryon incompatibility n=1 Tax=Moelleriella libera RCEF 2490 TaxID=1081109 RepID=A0A168E993_9HYPO|nr:Heterokaryon incompatibility [Moelleriella libera RCEF 2490]
MSRPLCDRCIRLDLRVERFVLPKTRPGNHAEEKSHSAESLRLQNERFELGTIRGLRTPQSDCPLCALLCQAVRGSVLSDQEDSTCFLLWELDGRRARFMPGRPIDERCTRRLRLFCVETDSRKVRRGPSLLLDASPRYDKPECDHESILRNNVEFLGRRIHSEPVTASYINSLLELCEQNHRRWCRGPGTDDGLPKTLRQPFSGIIDIDENQLVPFVTDLEDMDEWYAAVSYVRADSPSYATTIANVQDRRKPGGLTEVINGLPKALRQSVQLVRRMGIKYIWIDTVCVVQDSKQSWNLSTQSMHSIYGNAILTVCAADGVDASEGLVALDRDRQTKQHIEECAPGLHLMLHVLPEASIGASAWGGCAWTFQERFLSKRCLVFAGGQVYLQCRTANWSEDVFEESLDARRTIGDSLAPANLYKDVWTKAAWVFANSVGLYSRRSLYEPFARLAAFGGMCQFMGAIMGAPFSFGLPVSHFDFALLWQPVGGSSRLEKSRSGDARYDGLKLPSWSWCGWQSDAVEYNRQTLDCCFSDVHEWLSEHTWIDWHIRDRSGSLRRLLGPGHAGRDRSTHEKWRGYGRRPAMTGPGAASPLVRPAGPPRPGLPWPPAPGAVTARPTCVRPPGGGRFPQQVVPIAPPPGWLLARGPPSAPPPGGILPPPGWQPCSPASPPPGWQHPRSGTPNSTPGALVPLSGRGQAAPSATTIPPPSQVHDGASEDGWLKLKKKHRHRSRLVDFSGPVFGSGSGDSPADASSTDSDVTWNSSDSDSSSDSSSDAEPDSNRPAATGGFCQTRLAHHNVIDTPHHPGRPGPPRTTQTAGSFDAYGRPLNSAAMRRKRRLCIGRPFRLTLPEHPYCVSVESAAAAAEADHHDGGGGSSSPQTDSDLPMLQFHTWTKSFHLVEATASAEESTRRQRGHPDGHSAKRCHIVDDSGDKCGSIVVAADWLAHHQRQHETRFTFVAISEAKGFTAAELPDWTYYVPKERCQSEWDVYFVLLVEHHPAEGLHRRVALGKVFRGAFAHSHDEWQEIILG